MHRFRLRKWRVTFGFKGSSYYFMFTWRHLVGFKTHVQALCAARCHQLSQNLGCYFNCHQLIKVKPAGILVMFPSIHLYTVMFPTIHNSIPLWACLCENLRRRAFKVLYIGYFTYIWAGRPKPGSFDFSHCIYIIGRRT